MSKRRTSFYTVKPSGGILKRRDVLADVLEHIRREVEMFGRSEDGKETA
jgi:hypothetical protein